MHTDPEAVFLLSRLSNAGNYLFTSAQENMEKILIRLSLDKEIQLLPPRLKNDDAPFLGVSSLVWKNIDDNQL